MNMLYNQFIASAGIKKNGVTYRLLLGTISHVASSTATIDLRVCQTSVDCHVFDIEDDQTFSRNA